MSNMCLFNVDFLLRNTDQLHSSSSPAGQHSIRRFSKQPTQEWLFEARYMQLNLFSLSGCNNANQIHQKLYKRVCRKCVEKYYLNFKSVSKTSIGSSTLYMDEIDLQRIFGLFTIHSYLQLTAYRHTHDIS